MQTQSAFRVMLSIKDRSFQIESVTRVQKVLPPPASFEDAQERYGAWFAVEHPQGGSLYARLLNDFLTEGVEVFTGEKREFRRVRFPGVPQVLSILVPDILPEGVLAIYASETRKGVRPGAAKPVFRVSMRELAEMARKGDSHHGRE